MDAILYSVETPKPSWFCDLCDKKFSSKGNKTRHMKVDHPLQLGITEEFKCEVCLKIFKHKDNLKQHIKKHTN